MASLPILLKRQPRRSRILWCDPITVCRVFQELVDRVVDLSSTVSWIDDELTIAIHGPGLTRLLPHRCLVLIGREFTIIGTEVQRPIEAHVRLEGAQKILPLLNMGSFMIDNAIKHGTASTVRDKDVDLR